MNLRRILVYSRGLVAALFLTYAGMVAAQQSPAPAGAPPARDTQQGAVATSPAIRLTLEDALARARKNSTPFQSAQTDAAIARQDRYQAAAALLPSVTYNNQAIFTQLRQGNVAFIANNAAQEYVGLANVHESIDLVSISAYRRATAASALAKARAEIASRGLVVTVVQSYYAVSAAQLKLEAAKKNGDEGDRFLKLTQDLEKGGEVAHSDVIKAELQMQERRRQLLEAQLGLLNARLDFAVLIFPDFNDNFELAEDLHAGVPLPTLAEVQQRAARDNPDLRAALATVQQAGQDVNIWNWGATQSRIKQAELRRTQAQRELSLAQRKLLAEIKSLYAEADTALNELSGLSRSAELSAESLRLTTLRYKGGEATVLEVVDAQTTFAQANTAYQDGAVRYRVALANLQTLTGVLTTP